MDGSNLPQYPPRDRFGRKASTTKNAATAHAKFWEQQKLSVQQSNVNACIIGT